ncbi:MAG: hypothetical protein GX819_06105 [Clostridiaceae bacterium]|nr:hypothetical protein [Clostridiaceae bacterium]
MKPAIVIQTDFSRDSSSVATMYGVCQTVDPEVKVFDLTHSIPPFDIFEASHMLKNTAPFWPEGTLFVSVVDPGVGTDRRGCVALLANGQYVVSPDNGSLSHVLRTPGIRAVREIDMTVNRWPHTLTCHIFHGRDVFAYTAIRLASGIIGFEGVGPAYPVDEIVVIPFDPPVYREGVFTGIIESSGPYFGLVSSNIPDVMFIENGIRYGDVFHVEISHGRKLAYSGSVPFQKSFGYVKKGQPVLFVGATATIQIALRERNITKIHKIGAGPDWHISLAAGKRLD